MSCFFALPRQGGFCGAYSSWVTGYDQNVLARWRRNYGSSGLSDYTSIDDLFKCRASLLYPIFVNQWSGTVNDDKLLIGSVNTCVAVRTINIYLTELFGSLRKKAQRFNLCA